MIDCLDLPLPLAEHLPVTPSKPDPWLAPRPPEGERWTAYQKARMIEHEIEFDTTDTIMVRRRATGRELYIPPGHKPIYFRFECPVIGRRLGGKALVISPNGFDKLVSADGWITAPPAPKRRW